MQIYTGTCAGKKFEKLKGFGLGVMISPSPSFEVRKHFKDVPCVLDNGAYRCFEQGYPFRESAFLGILDECYEMGIKLDFIVCPDIIAGGRASLDFSLEWAGRLKTAPRLALVVQDGMVADMVDSHVRSLFTHLFVGGTPDWKWQTLPGWASFCASFGLKCHVGKCGTLSRLDLCKSLGVSSVDSTNFARNDNWSDIVQFQGGSLLPS